MKRLTKGKVYLYKARPPEDDCELWIMFRVDSFRYRDTESGREYRYSITIIRDNSKDDLRWEQGHKVSNFSCVAGEQYCREVPESEWTLYCLESD